MSNNSYTNFTFQDNLNITITLFFFKRKIYRLIYYGLKSCIVVRFIFLEIKAVSFIIDLYACCTESLVL